MTDGEVDGDRISKGVEPLYVERPPADVAASVIEAATERGRVVSLVGECEFHAPGGGPLARGDRHAILKPDGSVVVHSSDGTAPVAELSGTGGLDAAAVDGALEVEAVGDDGQLRFERVDLLVGAAVEGSVDTRVAGPRVEASPDEPTSDDDLHAGVVERLLAEPERVEPGFRPLSTERETSAGPVDLYGRDAEGRAVVVEIKTQRAGPAAVGQLDRYVAALGRDLHAGAEVRGVLVAPSATERTRHLLGERGFGFRALSPDGRAR